MALLARWEEKDLAGYFKQALQRNVAEDRENEIWIEESHGRSKWGLTKYRLCKHLGNGVVVIWRYKAYTDREAVQVAKEYIETRNFKGCKPHLDHDGIILHIYKTWPEIANKYYRSEFNRFASDVIWEGLDINTFPEWLAAHPEIQTLEDRHK